MTLVTAVYLGGCKDEDEGIVGVCPVVESTNPENLAVNVPLNQIITATFNEEMNAATITPNLLTLQGAAAGGRGAEDVSGVLSYDEATNTLTFEPGSNLLPSTTYTVRIAPTAKDEMGNALQAPYVWTFSTGEAPSVVLTDPLNLASNIALDKVISLTFSVPMDPSTITSSTFTLSDGTTDVPGTISYTGTVATFTPTADLMPETVYTATISAGATDADGVPLAGDYDWSFNTGMLPTVMSTNPVDAATAVLLGQSVTATFSEAMDESTISTATFTISDGAASVPGTVTYTGSTATFDPTDDFQPGVEYTATITAGAENPFGIPLASDFVWTFETGFAPTVNSTDPSNLATGVGINISVEATFSEAMDPLSITTSTFTLMDGSTPVSGSVSYTGNTATFNPDAALPTGRTYTATIDETATSEGGIPMGADFDWSFETGTPPTVISSDPVDLANNIALNKVLSVEFSEAMDPATISTSSFTLMRGANVVAGSVTYTGTTATFNPTGNLLSGRTYTATITTAAENLSGIPLDSDFSWTFSTVDPLGPPVVDLNSLLEYGIIAGVGVSNNAGPSEIRDMNVGIYPGVRTSITGFLDVDGGPGLIVNGNFHASDDLTPVGINADLEQAKLELVQAYDDAMGATTPAPSVAPADLGGQTLAPGIWTSASTMLLQNGDLTLDAQGDENAVWIFQVGSSFTSVGSGPFPSAAGGNVILTGGAKASNVFWVVGASAIIGDFTSFKGNILAFSSITMNSGARAEGRMLARNGSVVLTSTNIITRPQD